jgi:hypothetical protein
MRLILLALAVGVLQEPFDYSKVDRKIASEPKYVAAPKYALLLFGPEGKTRMWMAMDKSSVDAKHYDVLYLDSDGDGKLGEEGERFSESELRSDCIVILPGAIAIDGVELKGFRLHNYFGRSNPHIWVSMKVNDVASMSARDLQFASSPGKAPILYANPRGLLSFVHEGPDEMQIGTTTKFMLYAGIRGVDSFMAVDENFLKLDRDKIVVTVIAKDRDGGSVQRQSRLMEHC